MRDEPERMAADAVRCSCQRLPRDLIGGIARGGAGRMGRIEGRERYWIRGPIRTVGPKYDQGA